MKMRPSKLNLALLGLFAICGSLTMMSQNHASFEMIKNDEMNGLPIVDSLVLPSNSNYGAWSLTLQLLTADLIKDPQVVTTQLAKVVSNTVSTHGLLLLGLTTVDPSKSVSRGLKGATFTKRTSSQLLIGSAVDDNDDSFEDLDFDVETVENPSKESLFMRAIIASTQSSSESVAALVHLAKSGEIISWSKELKTAGLPIDGIEVVSLAPHAPNSVEAKLQAQLLILHEEMSEIDSFDETHHDDLESSFSSTALSAFSSNFAGEMISLALATILVACLAVLAAVQAKRTAAAAAAITASENFIRNSESGADLGPYSKITSASSYF